MSHQTPGEINSSCISTATSKMNWLPMTEAPPGTGDTTRRLADALIVTSEVGEPMTLYLNENTRPGAGHGLSGTSSPCFSHEATISWEFAHVFILMFFEI